jgi:hypothetical protein
MQALFLRPLQAGKWRIRANNQHETRLPSHSKQCPRLYRRHQPRALHPRLRARSIRFPWRRHTTTALRLQTAAGRFQLQNQHDYTDVALRDDIMWVRRIALLQQLD